METFSVADTDVYLAIVALDLSSVFALAGKSLCIVRRSPSRKLGGNISKIPSHSLFRAALDRLDISKSFPWDSWVKPTVSISTRRKGRYLSSQCPALFLISNTFLHFHEIIAILNRPLTSSLPLIVNTIDRLNFPDTTWLGY